MKEPPRFGWIIDESYPEDSCWSCAQGAACDPGKIPPGEYREDADEHLCDVCYDVWQEGRI